MRFSQLPISLLAPACAGLVAFSLAGCHRHDDHDHAGSASHASSAAPTNRIDIPAAVRRNLGITFARVESRAVAQTLRLPGGFELLPTAAREYHAPIAGRVEVLVTQYSRVEAGQPLARIDASDWRDLLEQIIATQARVDSMKPLREAHRQHERSLAEKVELWQQRLAQLEQLRDAGGGGAAQFTEARATLNATQAELADVMEKDAQLEAQQQEQDALLRSLLARRDSLRRSFACEGEINDSSLTDSFTLCAVEPGVVDVIAIAPGALATQHGHLFTVVAPDQLRFRARALQSDLARLREGAPALIVPPQGSGIALSDVMQGTLALAPTADHAQRTIDLLVQPTAVAPWARAGVAASLEVTTAGSAQPELAIPLSAVVRDGLSPVIFRRDPANPDQVIRLDADLGVSDGRWIVISSGVKEGDEVVLDGNYQLMLATSGSAPKGGHFHSDGTFHEEAH